MEEDGEISLYAGTKTLPPAELLFARKNGDFGAISVANGAV